MLGLTLPFEWTTSKGVRVGFDFNLGRAFGGSVRQLCTTQSQGTAGVQPCQTAAREIDREAGTAVYLHFQIGWGLNHPGFIKTGTE